MIASDLNMLISVLDKLSGRNEATLDKTNFRPDIRENLFLVLCNNIYDVFRGKAVPNRTKNNINYYNFNNFDYYNDNINHNFELKKMHK